MNGKIEVTIGLPPVSMKFEVGSIADVLAVLTKEHEGISQIQAFLSNAATPSEPETATVAETAEPPKGKPGRKPKNAADPTTASAPPPAPIPGVVIPADAMPANLVRPPNTPEIPAPPLAPAAAPPPPPPAPPAPPQFGVLAPKMIAELNKRSNGDVAAQNGLRDWLASQKFCSATATWEEVCQVVQFSTDAQLKQYTDALGVAA